MTTTRPEVIELASQLHDLTDVLIDELRTRQYPQARMTLREVRLQTEQLSLCLSGADPSDE